MAHPDPILFGIPGSIYVAFSLLAILGVMSPLKFVPVLIFQVSYKGVWYLAVLLPAAVAGTVPPYGRMLAVVFATFVIRDLIAVPWSHVLEPARREGMILKIKWNAVGGVPILEKSFHIVFCNG